MFEETDGLENPMEQGPNNATPKISNDHIQPDIKHDDSVPLSTNNQISNQIAQESPTNGIPSIILVIGETEKIKLEICERIEKEFDFMHCKLSEFEKMVWSDSQIDALNEDLTNEENNCNKYDPEFYKEMLFKYYNENPQKANKIVISDFPISGDFYNGFFEGENCRFSIKAIIYLKEFEENSNKLGVSQSNKSYKNEDSGDDLEIFINNEICFKICTNDSLEKVWENVKASIENLSRTISHDIQVLNTENLLSERSELQASQIKNNDMQKNIVPSLNNSKGSMEEMSAYTPVTELKNTRLVNKITFLKDKIKENFVKSMLSIDSAYQSGLFSQIRDKIKQAKNKEKLIEHEKSIKTNENDVIPSTEVYIHIENTKEVVEDNQSMDTHDLGNINKSRVCPSENQSPEQIVEEGKKLNAKIEDANLRKNSNANQINPDGSNREIIDTNLIIDISEIRHSANQSEIQSIRNNSKDYIINDEVDYIDYQNSAEISDVKEENNNQTLENTPKQENLLLRAEKEREALLEKLNKLDKGIQELKHDKDVSRSRSKSKRSNRNKSIDLEISNNEDQTKRIRQLLETPIEDPERREQRIQAVKNEKTKNKKKKLLDPVPTELTINDKIDQPQDLCESPRTLKSKKNVKKIRISTKTKPIDDKKYDKSFITNVHQSTDVKILNSFVEEQSELRLNAIIKKNKAAIDSANLVKRLNEEKKLRSEKIFKRKQKIQSYWDEQIQSFIDEKKVKKKETEEKRMHIYERIEKTKKEAYIRNIANRESCKVVSDLLNNSPDNNYFKKKYEIEVQYPEASRIEEIIQERKNVFRPIRLPEIAEHAAQHDERLNILNEVRSSIKSANKKRPLSTYKSEIYNKVAQEEEERKRGNIDKHNQKTKLAERRYEYGQYVNDYFMPKLDSGKSPFGPDMILKEPRIIKYSERSSSPHEGKDITMANYPHYRSTKPVKKKFKIIETIPNDDYFTQKSNRNNLSEANKPSNPFDISKKNITKSVNFIGIRNIRKSNPTPKYDSKDVSHISRDEIQRMANDKPLKNNAMRMMGSPNQNSNIFNQPAEQPHFFQNPYQRQQMLGMQNQQEAYQQNYLNNITYDQQNYNQLEQNQEENVNQIPYDIRQNRISSANYEGAKMYNNNTKQLRPWIYQKNTQF